jgi:hypothetical protein
MPRVIGRKTPPVSLVPTDADRDRRVAEAAPAAFDPPYEAFKLRQAGVPWIEVARQTGYPTPGAATIAVSHWLGKAAAQQSAQHQQEALQLAVSRYEKILQEWWLLGTTGHDEKAAGILLRTLQQLDRVQKLTDPEVQITRETLVISADPAEYVKQLKAAAAEREGN